MSTITLAQTLNENTGSGLVKVILAILGSIFLLFVVIKLVKAFGDEKYGKGVAILLFGALVGGFIYFPDQATGLLKSVWNLLIGT